ncbi:MAG: hypothetical protein HY749_05180 [Gammaproteobacteria bacterium]|nr:hypothetical protein [Gammaproteobacteria bacterium]MBI5618285.1 hypothetical protein [Gammaproteobacteria bacterium]
MYRKHLTRQRGLALVVALVLLLIMTMVAVVAMRTTALDLRMASNTTVTRRAFQNSDGARVSLGPMLDAHVFYRGWPGAIGGSLPANVVFPVPVEVKIADATKMYYMGDNGTLAEAIKSAPRAVDVRFRADVNNDGSVDAADMFADLWVSRLGALPAPGSGAAQGAGYLGPGVGAAGSDAYVFFDLRSKGESVGNAASTTSADYRALIRN